MNTADTAHNEGPSAFAKAAELELRHVSKRYAGQREPAIGDLSFTVPAGEVCVLVGPSGSGKTTAMRLINRMISISDGDILLGGRSVLTRDARELRREIGYVIQQIGLFPHQTVGENIGTVPQLLGWPKERIAARVSELLELIGLDAQEMAGRYPAQLSGGQRQRVGVARALAADPPLMLMDEPFGAIDPINRARLQDEFLGLQEKVCKTVVFVTHDIDEAIKMGDRIAILREGGRLAQYDTPREILIHPADDFVAEFVGADRSIKRLSLTTLGELKLIEPNGIRPGATRAPAQTSVRDALSMILTTGGEALTVVDSDDNVQGLLTLALIEQLLCEEAAADGDGEGSPSSLVVGDGRAAAAASAASDGHAAPRAAGG
ncbi:MAG TPA: ABC transporter ATP-binding protein [Solirubrobacteraceae bacterium]|nr:ABC transporter ATP-binding protein [Solirubrobacteraceae bacterium]